MNPAQAESPRIFKFFASVKLAIPLLIALILALAAGTFVESAHGADAARMLVYDSPWFSALLILLVINLAAAAFDRYPWKKKHIGFVITHLGIIVILAGSLVTQKTMVDGQMVIAEGETESRITLSQPLLYIYSAADQMDWMFYIKKQPFDWRGDLPLEPKKNSDTVPLPFKASLISYLPHSSSREEVVKNQDGPPAVKVTLKNSFLNQSQWLVLNDAELGLVQMGPAQLVFTDQLLPESSEEPSSSGYLEVEHEGKTSNISFPENITLPAEFPVEGTPYKIIIDQLFKNAVISGAELIEKPGEESNPAVKFRVKGPQLEERHTAFSRFPEFPTLHGMKPSAAGFKIFYRVPNSGSRGQSHELRFVQDGKNLKVQTRTGLKVTTREAKPGEEVPIGWMDLTYKIEEFLPHAEHRHIFSSVESGPQNQEPPAVQLRVQADGGEQSFWIGQGRKQEVSAGGKTYDFVFGEKRIPAGFKLTLKDFRVENDPGTEKPASFESDVILKDDMRGIERKVTISMNNPLVYRGFHVYQASYLTEEGRPEISVFAVGRDPGVPVKYAGALILIGGIIIMFFTRKPAKALEAEENQS